MTFFDGEDVYTVEGGHVPLDGYGCTAGVKKLKDGRLRLDMRVEKFAKMEAANADLRVVGASQRIVKVVALGETVSLELEGIGKKDAGIRVKLTVRASD